MLDPGVGFAKTADHNWTLLAMLDRLYALGRPLIIGTSRKSFLGSLLADVDGTPRPVDERDDATQATTAMVAAAGVMGGAGARGAAGGRRRARGAGAALGPPRGGRLLVP